MTITPERTPAEELRAAATRVRDAADQCPDKSKWYTAEDFAQSLCDADTAWLTLMHPRLAKPLAALLEEAAKGYESHAKDYDANTAECVVWDALTVARALNGGAP